MADTTLIAWTDHVSNYWMGCCKVSAGCKNWLRGNAHHEPHGVTAVWGPPATTSRQPVKGVWANVRGPEQERHSASGRPHRVFLGSLMDWAEDHPALDAIRKPMWEQIRSCKFLHFQMLTKRPERILQLLPADWGEGYPNVWLGTSIEDMHVADRADHLRTIPASVRFISYEPALGPLDDLDLTGIDWVIYGGESGPGHRPEDKQWARTMHHKCVSRLARHSFTSRAPATGRRWASNSTARSCGNIRCRARRGRRWPMPKPGRRLSHRSINPATQGSHRTPPQGQLLGLRPYRQPTLRFRKAGRRQRSCSM